MRALARRNCPLIGALESPVVPDAAKIRFYDVKDDGEFISEVASISHKLCHYCFNSVRIQIGCSIRPELLGLLLICCCNLIVVDANLIDLIYESVYLVA